MKSLSISYGTPERLYLLRSYMEVSGFDILRTTHDLVDVLVTADRVEEFKKFLGENRLNYTVAIEDVQEAVAAEYIEQQVQRRLQAMLRGPSPSRGLSFTYYPNYNEVSNNLLLRIQHSSNRTFSFIETHFKSLLIVFNVKHRCI